MNKLGKYPVSRASKRPYHLWNAKENSTLPYRYYKYVRNAHMGAMVEARWAEVGFSIEVYDARDGNLLGSYIRRTHTIDFKG